MSPVQARSSIGAWGLGFGGKKTGANRVITLSSPSSKWRDQVRKVPPYMRLSSLPIIVPVILFEMIQGKPSRGGTR